MKGTASMIGLAILWLIVGPARADQAMPDVPSAQPAESGGIVPADPIIEEPIRPLYSENDAAAAVARESARRCGTTGLLMLPATMLILSLFHRPDVRRGIH